MANLIDILINAKWKGAGEVKEAEQDLQGLGATAPKTGTNLLALAGKAALLTGSLYALKRGAEAAWRFLEEGASVELTRIRFDRLAASIGTSGDALERDLGTATQGLVSDMDALRLGTDLMALGLVKSHDEAVRLSSVASQLGFDMNQLVLTLTNNTTMRFDALGVSVDGFAEKVKKLEDAGYDADKAFDLAFIEQAEEQIERIGSIAETSAGQMAQIESNWQNSMDAIRQTTVKSLGPVFEYLTRGIIASNEAEAAIQSLQRAGDDFTDKKADIDELTQALDKLVASAKGPYPWSSVDDVQEYLLSATVAVARVGETVEEQQTILESHGFVIKDGIVFLGKYAVSWDEVNHAIQQVDYEELVAKHQDLNDGIDGTSDSMGVLSEEMLKLQEQIEAIEFKELLDNIGITSDEFIKLAYHMGGTAEATEYLEGVLASATPINFEYAASLARIDEKMIAIGTTAAGLEKLMAPLFEERAELFRDFQLDLSDISQTEGENRASTEAQYEERRTDIVEQYGERRAQAEEDYQRRQVRNAAKLAGDIEDAQGDSLERQADIRENANQRLEDLERDHAKRLTDIIRDANDDLIDAAGRLDASAIASITRRRERALEDEHESYQQASDDIQRTLNDQLEAERAASIARIADMQEYFAERQALDEEDHQLRLDRLEEANKDQLAVLEEKNAQELIEIQNAASLAQGLREIAYFQERTALGDHLGDKAKQEAQLQKDLLIAEEKWWKERTALIPDTSGAASLPDQFFAGAGPSRLELNAPINIYIDGADGPEATGLSVRDELLGLFGSFTQ